MAQFECVEEPDPLQRRLTEMEARLAHVDELYRRLDGSAAELEQARREREALQREVDRMHTMMDAIWSSLSWRVTTPLRKIKALRQR
jgi:hypothetical protein